MSLGKGHGQVGGQDSLAHSAFCLTIAITGIATQCTEGQELHDFAGQPYRFTTTVIEYAKSAALAFPREFGPGSMSEFWGEGFSLRRHSFQFDLFSSAESYAVLVEAMPTACIPGQLIHLRAAPALSPWVYLATVSALRHLPCFIVALMGAPLSVMVRASPTRPECPL